MESDPRYETKVQVSVPPLEHREWFKELQEQHPIEASVVAAAHRRFLEVRRLCTCYLDDPAPALAEFTAKLKPLVDEIHELTSWVYDPNLALPDSEVAAITDSLTKAYIEGGGKNVAEFIRSNTLRKPKGRRPKLRRAALRGLEMKHSAPHLSWLKIAHQVWPSKEEGNIQDPGHCLRQEVILLRDVLRKYGLPGWEPSSRYRAQNRAGSLKRKSR